MLIYPSALARTSIDALLSFHLYCSNDRGDSQINPQTPCTDEHKVIGTGQKIYFGRILLAMHFKSTEF